MTDLMAPVSLRSVSGERLTLRMPRTFFVKQVREAAANFLHCDISQVVLIFKREELDDSLSIDAIGLSEDSFIVALKKNPEAAAAKQTRPSKSQKTIDKNGRQVPDNIDALVRFIIGLQFTEHQARAALEFTGYDLRNAVILLAKGTTVGADGKPAPQPDSETTRTMAEDASSDSEDKEMRIISVRSQEERKLDEALKSFTDEQRMAVQRLSNRYHDVTTVLQVYLACDKDEHATAACLQTME